HHRRPADVRWARPRHPRCGRALGDHRAPGGAPNDARRHRRRGASIPVHDRHRRRRRARPLGARPAGRPTIRRVTAPVHPDADPERSDDGEPTGSPVLAVVVAAAGAGVLATGELVGRRQLDCSSDPALANSYSSRFFVRLALAETPGLLGFAGYVAVGRVELYLVGAAFALVGLSRAAPTVRRLAAETERLRGEGCGRDLRRALRAAAGGVS